MFLIYLLAYLIGQVLTAHIIGKIFYRQDIFQVGSGNPGARNAGRAFGKIGFLFVLLGDILKAVGVCWMAAHFGMGMTQQLVVLMFVLLGHMYPFIYKFKGGKGVASFLGGLLFISPYTTISLIIAFLIIFLFNRSFTTSGLIAILMTPIFLLVLENNIWASVVVAIIAIIINIRHLITSDRKGERA